MCLWAHWETCRNLTQVSIQISRIENHSQGISSLQDPMQQWDLVPRCYTNVFSSKQFICCRQCENRYKIFFWKPSVWLWAHCEMFRNEKWEFFTGAGTDWRPVVQKSGAVCRLDWARQTGTRLGTLAAFNPSGSRAAVHGNSGIPDRAGRKVVHTHTHTYLSGPVKTGPQDHPSSLLWECIHYPISQTGSPRDGTEWRTWAHPARWSQTDVLLLSGHLSTLSFPCSRQHRGLRQREGKKESKTKRKRRSGNRCLD